jgi:hypothetical protein
MQKVALYFSLVFTCIFFYSLIFIIRKKKITKNDYIIIHYFVK